MLVVENVDYIYKLVSGQNANFLQNLDLGMDKLEEKFRKSKVFVSRVQQELTDLNFGSEQFGGCADSKTLSAELDKFKEFWTLYKESSEKLVAFIQAFYSSMVFQFTKRGLQEYVKPWLYLQTLQRLSSIEEYAQINLLNENIGIVMQTLCVVLGIEPPLILEAITEDKMQEKKFKEEITRFYEDICQRISPIHDHSTGLLALERSELAIFQDPKNITTLISWLPDGNQREIALALLRKGPFSPKEGILIFLKGIKALYLTILERDILPALSSDNYPRYGNLVTI